MNWTVLVANPARKELARFPAKDRGKITAALRSMEIDPFTGDVLKLEGEKERYRRRVGSCRVFFTVRRSDRSVLVSAIARRSSTTY